MTTVNPLEIPSSDVQNLSRTFLAAIRRFYEDPENVRAFEEWKHQREETKRR